jgi:Protein of unknown function (DUF1997)
LRMIPAAPAKGVGVLFVGQVTLEVPKWFRQVPVAAIEATGSKVMQGVLSTMVPRFLAQLHGDYQRCGGV